MPTRQFAIWTKLIALCFLLSAASWAQDVLFHAEDQSFSVNLPSHFQPSNSPPNGTVLALETQGGFSLFCSKGEPVELDAGQFAERMKRNLYDGGAQILGKAQKPLAGQPAASFLVGGVVKGKESLFIFNQRPDAVYTFVFNYPVGQRQKASGIWNQASPTFKFRQAKAKKS
ncbi:MAG TPA: hypothetical protein EYO33_30075 [Phycisphaerales bacterium]|nr:hypothetical protein [Phycisphaerales bacterium]